MGDRTLFSSSAGPVGRGTLTECLREVGVSKGDSLMIHSSLFSLGRVQPGVQQGEVVGTVIEVLQEAVGGEGSLIFPTFTLSFCRTGHFDVQNTRSEMGALSEAARKMEMAVRTRHPVYSVAVLGPIFEILAQADTQTCFGEGSLFDRLHQLNLTEASGGKVKFLTIGIGVPPNAITYLHYLEEKMKVPYRYHKVFEGFLIEGGVRKSVRTRFYVRDLEGDVVFDGNVCWALWQKHKISTTRQLGNSMVCLLREKDVHDVTVDAIREKADFLCLGGYRPKSLQGF
jgi:aminoglycoside 3-N-acetyltransferase